MDIRDQLRHFDQCAAIAAGRGDAEGVAKALNAKRALQSDLDFDNKMKLPAHTESRTGHEILDRREPVPITANSSAEQGGFSAGRDIVIHGGVHIGSNPVQRNPVGSNAGTWIMAILLAIGVVLSRWISGRNDEVV